MKCKHIDCKWNKKSECGRKYTAVVVDTRGDDAVWCLCLSTGKRNWNKKEEAFEGLEGFVGNPCGYCNTPLAKMCDKVYCPTCEAKRFV